MKGEICVCLKCRGGVVCRFLKCWRGKGLRVGWCRERGVDDGKTAVGDKSRWSLDDGERNGAATMVVFILYRRGQSSQSGIR